MAYRRGRSRRNNGTWLPIQGTVLAEDVSLWGFGANIPVQPNGDIQSIVTPITTDEPLEGDDILNNTTMSTVVGNEYFLDRIVGKLFIEHFSQLDDAAAPVGGPVLVAAGFFIARADEGSPNLPIGNEGQFQLNNNYSPLEMDNSREPWIWRRTWLLGTGGAYADGVVQSRGARAFPASNVHYGSVLDGPHLDAKTKRRVGQDDRLWFICSVAYPATWFGGPVPLSPEGTQGAVELWLDFRLHGALRRSRPSGKF